MRLLAQAPSLPFFMGTMSFCIEAAVEEVGGEAGLEPGRHHPLNDPYETGSHPQDAAVVMPVYLPEGELVGYAAIKAHWLDIGAKEIYCTDTTDVFQEGTIFPGVKLYRRGELVEDISEMAVANSRLPKFVLGDINAEVAGVRAGGRELVRLVRALRAGGVFQLRRADVRPRRGRRAQLHREVAGRPLRRPRRDGRRRHLGRGDPVRSHARDRGHRPPASTSPTRRRHVLGRSTARSRRPCRRLASS